MKELLTTDDLAKLLGYSKATVNTYVALNKLPKPKKIYGKRLWEREQVEKWLKEKGINLNKKEDNADG